MRTDQIQCKNGQNLNLIKGVEKIQKSSETKDFDYYSKRGLTKEEQGKNQNSITPKEAYERRKRTPRENMKTEKEKVREFKKTLNAKKVIEAYKKTLKNEKKIQEHYYQENKEK